MSKKTQIVVAMPFVVVGAQFAEHLKDPLAGKGLDVPLASIVASTTTTNIGYTSTGWTPYDAILDEVRKLPLPPKPGTTEGST